MPKGYAKLLSEDQLATLIMLVHLKKAIWCKSENGHRNSLVVAKMWNKISQEMGIDTRF